MKLQLTIDHGKRHEVLALADMMYGHVDIIEIGYPQIMTFGLSVVEDIKRAHPDLPVCVDAKVYHGGSGVTRRCFDAGADIVTVLSGAPNPVIAAMVGKAHSVGGKICCDMVAAPNAVGKRCAEVDELGVDYIMVSTAYIPDYDYDIEAHAEVPKWWRVRPLDLAGVAKRNIRTAKLALHTGINESNIRDVVKMNPELVLVGRGILSQPDWQVAADRLKRYMPFEG